jgi:AraC family transcriptional regulator of adaptative response/methylated-DNA-[protein]-cysteine methyltransferase
MEARRHQAYHRFMQHALTPPQASVPDDTAWEAVTARDGRFDGRLVYAVRSTGVYCRPSCASRRPLRRNVRFFGTSAEAEQAGYRACRRCRPGSAPSSRSADLVDRVRRYIESNLDEPVTLEALGAEVGLSPEHVQRTFKRATGVSPREYAESLRIERFKSRVKKGDTVSMATYEAGFGSSSRLYEKAATRLGMTPAAYRHGGRGMRIRFTTVASPLGRLLVASTERGVCAVTLGDDDGRLEDALRREYPEAEIERARAGLETAVSAVVSRLEGAASAPDVPLDIRPTAFQRQVWKALQEIPAGETRSYREVAAAIGRPSAARAVARACATNPVAIVIPCHRVVREGGGLGGYRWGTTRKTRLLENERASGSRKR